MDNCRVSTNSYGYNGGLGLHCSILELFRMQISDSYKLNKKSEDFLNSKRETLC